MLAEILKSARGYASLVLIASLGWLVSAGEFENTFDLKKQATELAAYVLLRDTFANLGESNLFTADIGSAVSQVTVPHKLDIPLRGSGSGFPINGTQIPTIIMNETDNLSTVPLEAKSPWGERFTSPLKVQQLKQYSKPEIRSRVLEISAERTELPFSDYWICNCLPPKSPGGRDPINQSRSVQILRKGATLEPARALFGDEEEWSLQANVEGTMPIGWETIVPFLVSQGMKGSTPQTLSPSDVSVIMAVNDYIKSDSVRREIAENCAIPIVFLPFGIGAFVILVSALQWGNIVALRRERRARQFEETSWVMLPFGVQRWELGVSICFASIVSCIAIAIPGSAAVRAGWLILQKGTYEKQALFFLCCALLLAVGIQGIIVLEQFRLWKESRKEQASPIAPLEVEAKALQASASGGQLR